MAMEPSDVIRQLATATANALFVQQVRKCQEVFKETLRNAETAQQSVVETARLNYFYQIEHLLNTLDEGLADHDEDDYDTEDDDE